MPTEWPPKQPAPKPSGPDPEAVRKALAEIDAAWQVFRSVKSPIGNPAATALATAYLETCRRHSNLVETAARAWLAAQDSTGEVSE